MKSLHAVLFTLHVLARIYAIACAAVEMWQQSNPSPARHNTTSSPMKSRYVSFSPLPSNQLQTRDDSLISSAQQALSILRMRTQKLGILSSNFLSSHSHSLQFFFQARSDIFTVAVEKSLCRIVFEVDFGTFSIVHTRYSSRIVPPFGPRRGLGRCEDRNRGRREDQNRNVVEGDVKIVVEGYVSVVCYVFQLYDRCEEECNLGFC
ncbi:hypothetical protein Sjap_020514 [Stephania japonica]|uniref:Uncharacterized protein n=1 Tax=Stephania japonica TaxID=461633 RepID=A0AAP0I0H6_9MAGN